MTAIRSTATEALIAKLEARDIPTCARLISRIEDRDPDLVALLTTLYLRTMRPRAIGITGPPGIGKSTIINSLIEKLRCRGGTVAVLAIDPSSARSGGAVLGDRLRLSRHQDDQDVYIRSMATRGDMGGLAVAVADVLIVLAAMRWDVIILESVGVGQNEVDIGMYADTVVVLQSAHGGDEIQMTKAGLLEIADIFVVNKCDDPNTARMTSALRDMVHRAHAADVFTEWLPPVIETQANIDSGIDSLMAAIDARASFIAAHPEVPLKRERAQVVARIEAAIVSGFRTISRNMDWEMQSLTEDIVARRTDPYSLAGSIAKRILGTIIRE